MTAAHGFTGVPSGDSFRLLFALERLGPEVSGVSYGDFSKSFFPLPAISQPKLA